MHLFEVASNLKNEILSLVKGIYGLAYVSTFDPISEFSYNKDISPDNCLLFCVRGNIDFHCKEFENKKILGQYKFEIVYSDITLRNESSNFFPSFPLTCEKALENLQREVKESLNFHQDELNKILSFGLLLVTTALLSYGLWKCYRKKNSKVNQATVT